jgi:hypothetical protein
LERIITKFGGHTNNAILLRWYFISATIFRGDPGRIWDII